PSNLAGWYAHHQCIGRNVFVDHSASAYKSILSYGHSTHDRAVGSQSCALSYQGVAVFVLALNQRSRVVDVGKHHTGATEHPLLQRYVVVYRNVVLDFAFIADHYFIADEHVLAQRYTDTNPRAGTNVDKVPDP